MLPVLEQLFVRDKTLISKVIHDVNLICRGIPIPLQPIVSGARAVDPRLDIDVVGTTGGPIVAGAFPIVVLPRGAKALCQFARLQQFTFDDPGASLKEWSNLEGYLGLSPPALRNKNTIHGISETLQAVGQTIRPLQIGLAGHRIISGCVFI